MAEENALCMKAPVYAPRLIAWELTRECRLQCLHCRMGAASEDAEELSGEQCFLILEGIAAAYKPIIILTGGDPFLREDLFPIALRGSEVGLTMVAASCGVGFDKETALRCVRSGIRRVSFSLDGATAGSHDAFRGVSGSFEQVLNAMAACREAALDFQVNTTVTRYSADELKDIADLAGISGAKAFHPFFFVPTGRGRNAAPLSLDAEEYEQILHRIHSWSQGSSLSIKVTCAPQYYRIAAQRDPAGSPVRHGRGCMAGESFAFISATGDVKPCGFLDLVAGNLRDSFFDFEKIWSTSELFARLRNRSLYSGKCAGCAYEAVCGGCRARAYEVSGNLLGEEPFCAYG